VEPGYSLELVQTQKLILTPELRQAIMVLQMNVQELAQFILREVEANPLLDVSDEQSDTISSDGPVDDDYEEWIAYFADSSDLGVVQTTLKDNKDQVGPSYQDIPETTGSIWDVLSSQLGLLRLGRKELEVARFVIGNIDGNGYLRCSVSDVASAASCTERTAESVIRMIQGFEPAGICARDLRECLELQAVSRGLGDLELRIIRAHLEDLGQARYSKIAEEEQVSIEDVLRARDSIVGLDPKPGASLSYTHTTYILPDITVKKLGDEFVVILNENTLPVIRWNPYYRKLLSEGQKETKDYLTQQAKRAYYLMKSVEQRRMTISRVMDSILKHQKRFFIEGPGHLEPMTLSDIADELGIHASTVSRAISGKYVDTPFGLFPCKMFFGPGIKSAGDEVSQYNVKRAISEIVGNEDPRNPLTDNQISEVLSRNGIFVARRTVAKYRSQLGIPASNRRKGL
jgi:RNA polymerase sigma-54 factor